MARGEELSSSVSGYRIEISQILAGTELNSYRVWIYPTDRWSKEKYAAIRILPDEVATKEDIIAILAESYANLPTDKQDAVFGEIADLLLQLKLH